MYSDEVLTLRPWSEGDLESFYQIYSHDEVSRWLGAKPRKALATLDEAKVKLDAYRTLHGEVEAPCGMWAIVPAGSSEPVGTALLLPLRKDGVATGQYEIGWHLHPDWWGKGLATKAATALIGAAQGAGISELLALCDVENEKSFAVMQRLGMRDEGVTDEWYGLTLRQTRWVG